MIIPAWNSRDVLGSCLDSIEAQEFPGGLETIVVDNASTDGTAELLREYRDRVAVVTNEENAGFSAANNQGARQASGRVFFFFNSDTELRGAGTLARLADAVEQPGVGLVGPRLVNPDGSLQASCAKDPSVGRALLLAFGLHRLLPDRWRARLSPDTWSHDRARDVDWLKGAALAVRADAFAAAGGFWPLMYGEEQDLAYRLRDRGLRVRFEPSTSVMHVGNHSGGQRWSDPQRAARVARAELAFLRAHYPRPRAAAIRAITLGAFAARAAIHGLLARPQAGVYRSMARVYASGAGG